MQKSLREENEEPYRKDVRSMFFKDFLKASIDVKFLVSGVREFQQSTERYRNEESSCLLAKRGFWMKGVGRRDETGGK